jgi:hypothetical protein
MELTAGNLSRPRALAANSKSVQGVLFSARSESSSVEIVKTWLGFPYICEFFSDLPTPPTYIHAAQKIPTHSTRSILGGPAGLADGCLLSAVHGTHVRVQREHP